MHTANGYYSGGTAATEGVIAMEQHEPDSRSTEEARAREEHKTWVERYLGEGWQEVEPGIYQPVGQRRTGARRAAAGTGCDPQDELGDALDPAQASPPPRSPPRALARPPLSPPVVVRPAAGPAVGGDPCGESCRRERVPRHWGEIEWRPYRESHRSIGRQTTVRTTWRARRLRIRRSHSPRCSPQPATRATARNVAAASV